LFAGRLDTRGLRATFFPPLLPRGALLGPVGWQVSVASDAVFLYRDNNADADAAWSWRGALLAPAPAVNAAEAERWLSGTRLGEGDSFPTASIACWRTELEALQVLQVPRAAWLLGCSV